MIVKYLRFKSQSKLSFFVLLKQLSNFLHQYFVHYLSIIVIVLIGIMTVIFTIDKSILTRLSYFVGFWLKVIF